MARGVVSASSFLKLRKGVGVRSAISGLAAGGPTGRTPGKHAIPWGLSSVPNFLALPGAVWRERAQPSRSARARAVAYSKRLLPRRPMKFSFTIPVVILCSSPSTPSAPSRGCVCAGRGCCSICCTSGAAKMAARFMPQNKEAVAIMPTTSPSTARRRLVTSITVRANASGVL